MNPKSERHFGNEFRTDLVLSGPLLEKALSAGRLPAQGELLGAALPRLMQEVVSMAGPVSWALAPDAQPPGPGRWRRRWWLTVNADLVCTCERCLAPVSVGVAARRAFEFFESSAQADVQSERLEDDDLEFDPDAELVDYLSPEDGMTIATLVEDEVLLNMPMAPKHEQCGLPAEPGRLAGSSTEGDALGDKPQTPSDQPETTRPFLGLKELLKKR